MAEAADPATIYDFDSDDGKEPFRQPYRHVPKHWYHAAVLHNRFSFADPSSHPAHVGIDCEMTGPGHSGRVVSVALVGVNAARQIVIVACWNFKPTFPADEDTIKNFWNRVSLEMRQWLKGTRPIDREGEITEMAGVIGGIKCANPLVDIISDYLAADNPAIDGLLTEIGSDPLHQREINGNPDSFVPLDDIDMQMRNAASLAAGKRVSNLYGPGGVYEILGELGYKRFSDDEIKAKLRAVMPDLPDLLLSDHSAIFDAAKSLWQWLAFQDFHRRVRLVPDLVPREV